MNVKKCKCGSITAIVDSRLRADGSVWRRRKCFKCEETYTTFEVSKTFYDKFEKLSNSLKDIKINIENLNL